MKRQINKLSKEAKDFNKFITSYKKLMPTPVKKILTEELSNLTYRLNSLKTQKKEEDKRKKMERTEKPANLIQFLANAQTTCAQAGGHGKGNANEAKANYWREVLKKRKIIIPSNEELYKLGQFNGKGSV